MPTFSPPIGIGIAWGDPDSSDPAQRLMSFYGSLPQGETVYKTQAGQYIQTQYPSAGRPDAPGLDQAIEYYLGGHIYDITDTQALLLIINGYSAYVNKQIVDLTYWKHTDLAKFTRVILTENSSAVPVLGINSAEQGTVTESSGLEPFLDSSRNFWKHADLEGNTDFDATCILDPLNYGLSPEGQVIAEQAGLALRIQVTGGKHRGITINNNIFFVIPHLNIGVWSSDADGTNFLNRQQSLAIGLLLPFPYQFDIKLRSNIIQVRAYTPGLLPPSWTDPIYAITIDLDSFGDTVNNPTPIGEGSAGPIGAHLGTDPRVAARFRFKIGPAASLFP